MSGRLVGLIIASLALLVLGGCVSRSAPPPGDVVLMLRATPAQLEVWNEAVKAFTEATKISVTIQNEPYDRYFAKLQTMIAGGKPPDVVFMESTRFPEFVTKGALEKLDTYLAGQTEIKANDFFPTAWQAYQYQGSVYGLPNDTAILAVAYDQNQLELATLKPPTPGWTWDDYLKMAQDLTVDRSGDGQVDVWGTTICPWWQVYVWQNGGDLMDDVQTPRRSALSTPAAQEALQFLADLHTKHQVAPSLSLTRGMGRVDAFVAGRVAMIYTGRWDGAQLSKTDSRWDTAALPRGKQAANLGLGSGFCIAKGAPHAQEAWKLISFLAGMDGQKIMLGGGFSTPARKALVNSEYFALGAGDRGAGAFAAGLKVMHPVPFTTHYTEISEIWEQELDLLWAGKATVQEVTQRIDERVNKVLAEGQPATAWLLPVSFSPSL